MTEGRAAFEALDHAWQLALSEAWVSWASGNAGVGSAITDAKGAVVAVGRNRVAEPRHEPGVLASTFLAHGEMQCARGTAARRSRSPANACPRPRRWQRLRRRRCVVAVTRG